MNASIRASVLFTNYLFNKHIHKLSSSSGSKKWKETTVSSASYYHAALLYYSDNVLRKPVQQHDAFITVNIEFINEAKPVYHQTRAEP